MPSLQPHTSAARSQQQQQQRAPPCPAACARAAPPPPPFTCVHVPHARALPRLQPDLVPEEGDVGAGPLLHRGGVRELEVGQDHSSRAARQRAGVYLPGWVVVGWVWWWWWGGWWGWGCGGCVVCVWGGGWGGGVGWGGVGWRGRQMLQGEGPSEAGYSTTREGGPCPRPLRRKLHALLHQRRVSLPRRPERTRLWPCRHTRSPGTPRLSWLMAITSCIDCK